MKLEIAMLAGNESKQFLASLSTEIDRLEKVAKQIEKLKGGLTASAETALDEDDEDFTEAPKAKRGRPKKAAAVADFDDDGEDEESDTAEETEAEEEETEAEAEEAEETTETPDDEDEAPVKSKKAKKVTVDDVNDACKKLAQHIGGPDGRKYVLGILKKKFKTESVSALDESQYEACIKAMVIPA